MSALVVSAPTESRRLLRRRRLNLLRGIAALLTVWTIGAIGFRVIEGDDWSWMDAAYMAVITMSTVGFEEVRPLSEMGRVFSMVIIVTGVGAGRDRESGESGLRGFSGFGDVDDGVDGSCDGAGSDHRCTCDVAGLGSEVAACRCHEGGFDA